MTILGDFDVTQNLRMATLRQLLGICGPEESSVWLRCSKTISESGHRTGTTPRVAVTGCGVFRTLGDEVTVWTLA